MSEEITLHSMIKKHFTPELLFEIERLSMNHSVDNNTKGVAINKMLSAYNVPFSPLGSGTNRYAVLIEDYVFKIALDKDGMTDNKREFIYSRFIQPYVIKFYEVLPNGLVGVCEYYEVFSQDDFYITKNQLEMKRILKEISNTFLIGDIGIYKKNYTNWGYRQSDGSIGILDFAYCYKLSYQVFQCTCKDRGMLYYDDNYTQLICPFCGAKHTFWDVRKRIPREQEQAEIGDIKSKGYVLSSEWQTVKKNPAFYLNKKKKKKKEHIKIEKQKNPYDALDKYQPSGYEAFELFKKELEENENSKKETEDYGQEEI